MKKAKYGLLWHGLLSIKFSNHNISKQAETLWGYGSFLFIILVAGGYAFYLGSVAKDETSPRK